MQTVIIRYKDGSPAIELRDVTTVNDDREGVFSVQYPGGEYAITQDNILNVRYE